MGLSFVQGMPAAYIDVLTILYVGQYAQVKCEVESRDFDISRGNKQGDPISPIHLTLSWSGFLSSVKVKWKSKKWGVQLGPHSDSTLTNLRFADDVLTISRGLAVSN